MSSLTWYNDVQVVTPDPADPGGLAINNNFKALSDGVDGALPLAGGTMAGTLNMAGQTLNMNTGGGSSGTTLNMDGGVIQNLSILNIGQNTNNENAIDVLSGTGARFIIDGTYATAITQRIMCNENLFMASITTGDNGSIYMDGGQIIQLRAHNNSGAPASPNPGQIYFDTSDNHFYGWNGSAWKQLDN